jgi:hypothetical protein
MSKIMRQLVEEGRKAREVKRKAVVPTPTPRDSLPPAPEEAWPWPYVINTAEATATACPHGIAAGTYCHACGAVV